MNVSKSRLKFLPLVSCAMIVASCGGGGGDSGPSGSGQLSGSVTLNASAEIATPSSMSATLPPGSTGQPSCVLIAGQVPPGMSLTNCTLQGIPTSVGSFASQLTLTIPGYSGSTRVDATILIAGPTLGPSPVPAGTGLPLNVPVTGLSVVGLSTLPPFSIRPTDVLVYHVVSGVLPDGLAFDPSTALISGTPTQSGVFPLTISATLTRGSATYELPSYVTPGIRVL